MGRLAIAAALLAALAAPSSGAQAWTFKVIHNFCSDYACYDGSKPQSALTMDSSGRLYGVASEGGPNSEGTAFQLSPVAGRWRYSRLYSFCAQPGCADGVLPNGPLVMDVNGNLYGTTQYGGLSGDGIAFELTLDGNRTRRSIQILHAFVPDTLHDGGTPIAGLTYQGAAGGALYDGVSPLYGTTLLGGENGDGAAFVLAPVDGTWHEAVIYSFCSRAGCSDGTNPESELIIDSFGNLYGTTPHGFGGSRGTSSGVVFKLTEGSDGWEESVVHGFCNLRNCKDGAVPATLTMEASGDLLGTTLFGGEPNKGCCGTLFELGSDGSAFNVRRNFCSKRLRCTDGSHPRGALIVDSTGTVFGTTVAGGANYDGDDNTGPGVVFALSGSSFELLHRFCAETNCTDGKYPYAGLVMDASGNLFGTTRGGGKFGGGTVFELSP